jgi:hypothetical protein
VSADEDFAIVERAVKALERIADVLERAIEPPPAPADEPGGCEHPAEARIDFGITNGEPDWQCRACGFRTVPPAEGA